MNDAANERGARRRRSWYRRRLRMRRSLIAVLVGTVLGSVCWQSAARYFSSSRPFPQGLASSFWGRMNLQKVPALAAARSFKAKRPLNRFPGVYPYSVVPGGVKDPNDLQTAALRDSVVRRHFAHFDYSHARLVRATEAREVYLSYRIRDTVFWTRRRVRLHPGELLLTDGKITARAQCGNQISDTAKPEVSDQEPDVDILDQPVALFYTPSMPILPGGARPDLPVGQPTPPQLFGNGFIFPYAPFHGPLPVLGCPAGELYGDGHCRHKRKRPVVPEPSTLQLLGTGLALTMWRYRKTRAAQVV